MTTENWLENINDEHRLWMKGAGSQLMALLLQYNSRADGGEVFLAEAKRVACEYREVCSSLGLSLREMVHIFLFFRRSILDVIHETAHLGGADDYEGLRLFRRTNEFFDEVILDLIGSEE